MLSNPTILIVRGLLKPHITRYCTSHVFWDCLSNGYEISPLTIALKCSPCGFIVESMSNQPNQMGSEYSKIGSTKGKGKQESQGRQK